MKPSKDKIKLFSNELQVTPQTPPTWLIHAGDDTVVVVANSIQFYEALVKNKVPAETHLYPKGGHICTVSTNRRMDAAAIWVDVEEWIDEIVSYRNDTGQYD